MIINLVNEALEQNLESKHLKVVAVKFNNQGSLILSIHANQKAAELMNFIKLFINQINCRYGYKCREDKWWFKIQVDGISMMCTTMDYEKCICSEEEVHNELINCNPVYQQAAKFLKRELQTTHLSSVVFAIDNEDHVKIILGTQTLAAFSRHCTMRAYQDHPPIPQCKNCWSLDHKQDKCTNPTTCRLCGQTHHETKHPTSAHASYPPDDANTMNTVNDITHSHFLKCSNCVKANLTNDLWHPADSRRCPDRLQKYGTAQIVEKKAMKSSNPWKTSNPIIGHEFV